MTKSKIIFKSFNPDKPAKGYWDQTLFVDLINSIKGRFMRKVIVIPSEYQAKYIDEINEFLGKYKKVLLYLSSDEENKFNPGLIDHPDCFIVSSYFDPNVQGVDMWIPCGYTPHTRSNLKNMSNEKDLTVSFMGQVNNDSRRDLERAVNEMEKPILGYDFKFTDGFAQGYEEAEYMEVLSRSQIALCPPGAVNFDSFRIYEALEAMACPVCVVETGSKCYYTSLSGAVSVRSWDEILSLLPDATYEDLRKRSLIAAIKWLTVKARMRADFKAILGVKDRMVVIVPTSPIPSHPSTEVIEETLDSIRMHTDADIIIQCDGVREEQESMRGDYERYLHRLTWLALHKYDNVVLEYHSLHTHQVGMMRASFEALREDVILYVEHDTPLVVDKDIPLGDLANLISSGEVDVIRFHYESSIPESHKYLMMGDVVEIGADYPLQRTKQWSQRPHLASSEYYRKLLEVFSPDAKSMIEDRIHGYVIDEVNAGKEGDHRIYIYHPEENIKFSTHTDGRKDDPKYEMKF